MDNPCLITSIMMRVRENTERTLTDNPDGEERIVIRGGNDDLDQHHLFIPSLDFKSREGDVSPSSPNASPLWMRVSDVPPSLPEE